MSTRIDRLVVSGCRLCGDCQGFFGFAICYPYFPSAFFFLFFFSLSLSPLRPAVIALYACRHPLFGGVSFSFCCCNVVLCLSSVSAPSTAHLSAFVVRLLVAFICLELCVYCFSPFIAKLCLFAFRLAPFLSPSLLSLCLLAC